MVKKYNKLVRDKIPEIIENSGETPVTRNIGGHELLLALLTKLVEESVEMQEGPNIEERADIEEVLRAIDKAMGFSPEQIEAARAAKAEQRGGFEQGIFLEETN